MNTPWHARLFEWMKEFPFITTAIVLVILTLAIISIVVPGGWFWCLAVLGFIMVITVFVGVIYELMEKM